MNPQPSWLDRPVLLAPWDARAESPAEIARRAVALLAGIDEALGEPGGWSTDRDAEVTAQTVEPLIEAGVYVDDLGVTFASGGYRLHVTRRSNRATIWLTLQAGASVPGRRLPANHALIKVFPSVPGGVTATLTRDILLATAASLEPPAAAFRDTEGASAAAGRGRWAPVIGPQTWIAKDLGSVTVAPPGVTIEPRSDGTLLTAAPELGSEDAVRAVWAALQSNDITEIPHGERVK